MALVACSECGHEVSDQALKCPSCGSQIREPERSTVGKIAKWLFIAFNLLMVIWIVSALNVEVPTSSSAEQAGAAIGKGIGATILFVFWVFGDIILGLFALLTRPSSS